jgi:hypothetical protein
VLACTTSPRQNRSAERVGKPGGVHNPKTTAMYH